MSFVAENIGFATADGMNGGMSSIYCGGFLVDRYDNLHVVLNLVDAYLGDNRATAIYYLWSPLDTSRTDGLSGLRTGGVSTVSGSRWYSVDGNLMAETWQDSWLNRTPLGLHSDQAASALVATSSDYQAPSNWYNRSFHTNSEGMALHPLDTVRVTTDIGESYVMQKPYFTFHEWYSDVNNEVLCWMAYHSAGHTDAGLNGWVTRNISTAIVTNGYTSSVRAWKGRHYGQIYVDKNDTIHIYGMIKDTTYANNYKDSAWWSGELAEWYSQDLGETWDFRYITRRSSEGIGMISVKPNLDNNTIELVQGVNEKIYYSSEDLEFGRVQDAGEDVVVRFTGDSANSILNATVTAVGDFWQNQATRLTFVLNTSIPLNRTYSTAGMYYIYFGKDTGNPLLPFYDPTNAFGVVESFEGYTPDTPSEATRRFSLNSPRSGSNPTSCWQVRTSVSEHTNKIFSGDKAMRQWNYSTPVSTAYMYTALPTNYTVNIRGRMNCWWEYTAPDLSRMTFGIKSSDRYYAVGMFDTAKFHLCSATGWSTADQAGSWFPSYNHYNSFEFVYVDSTLQFYANGSALGRPMHVMQDITEVFFGYGSNPDYFDGYQPELFWDLLIVEKAYSIDG